MKRLFALLLGVLFLTGCGTAASSSSYERISQEEAAEIMASQEDYLILDVRTPEEFAQGHIPGAVNIPNEDIGTEPIEALPRKDQTLLVYCRSGNRSRQASQKLADQGYTKVLEFGGINTWPGEIVRD